MAANDNKVPTNRFNDKFSSLIRPIKIFLPPKENREQKNDGDDYNDFVGRDQLMDRLFNWLSDKDKEKGSYLVTGFRGMGKTSLVNRVTSRLTRPIQQKDERWYVISLLVPFLAIGLFFAFEPKLKLSFWISVAFFAAMLVSSFLLERWILRKYIRKARRNRKKYPNAKNYDPDHVDQMARGKEDDLTDKQFNNIQISINLGHEVLKERDVLSMIATSVRDKYKRFVKSIQPHLCNMVMVVVLAGIFGFLAATGVEKNVKRAYLKLYSDPITVYKGSQPTNDSIAPDIVINTTPEESWLSRMLYNTGRTLYKTYKGDPFLKLLFRFILFTAMFFLCWWIGLLILRRLPYYSTPSKAIRRLDTLVERIVATMDEETEETSTVDRNLISISLFSRRRRKTVPIADIREIETELADIINQINSNECPTHFRARFFVVFDEMDKIDPAMMEQHKTTEMPEFTDSVKGFPDGMDSRERRRNVLKLLANIKLFVSTANAKFIFISGRELYDAYLADLSDRDFAISSIFSGVINVDSFLTPEGGQTDVRSMSEWYIANRLIPDAWLREKEKMNANAALKKERPSLRWYYEYLIDECHDDPQEAYYVIGFLHTFAAYLTHISNGSPKKIYLYFDKYLRCASDCRPMNDWDDVCTVGRDSEEEGQRVLYFEPIQQRTICFVYYLSNPIMGAITNDMSNYGDRFLVSLSFIIDHIYKYHNRSFSWRNLEQIPDLLKTSKAPELRDEMTAIMEYLSQIHISPILIGLNEYKFHKSIAEEISVMSRMSDEASAIFNFTLDESLSVIQYNTRLLNYYIELDKQEGKDESHKHQYLPLIARIHSNLGDLHFWDEDYYSATLEYRAAIETLPDTKDESGFLTRIRCMLKLGLAYELRKLYPNAYQTYCRLINLLIQKRWVNEVDFGLTVMDARIRGWQEKRQVMVNLGEPEWTLSQRDKFEEQFKHPLFSGDYNNKDEDDKDEDNTEFSFNFDGVINTFASDLTPEKSRTINTLTLFEEIRYLYQSVLAKLSILEKMGMSGITQTNISVAEGEFRTIHKSVNIREKFIIAADFFRKLAEILYYKNSLTILTQNQDSFYVSVYYDDHDLLANLDDFCMQKGEKALTTKHDVRYFFYRLNNSASNDEPKLAYPPTKEGWCKMIDLYQRLYDETDNLLKRDGKLDNEEDRTRIIENVRAYLEYNIKRVEPNKKDVFYSATMDSCNCHSLMLRQKGLRTPCYACKYYTRSLRILADNMFAEASMVLRNPLTKPFGILKHSFKKELLYTNSTSLRALAQTLEGFGNVMYSCASGDNYEGEAHLPKRGVSKGLIDMLQDLSKQLTHEGEMAVLDKYEERLAKEKPLSRLDKAILYYWDAYRFYLMDGSYNDAVGCLNKILNMFVYYIEVVCYYGKDSEVLKWKDETGTIASLIGDAEFNESFVETLFRLIVRYTSYKYDFTNLNEINELKWIYSKEMRDNVDLTKLSLYPAIRSSWLRAVEIRAKGLRFLAKNGYPGYGQEHYTEFIEKTYPLVAPQRRYETTFYEEVLGYYTKMRYNDHIMNNLMGGTPMVDRKAGDYSNPYHINFYEKLRDFLVSDIDEHRLDYILFGIGKELSLKSDLVKGRLELIEFLINDTLLCITEMVNVFTPHNHLTSYSKSFVGLVYNYYWEWSRKYEFLYGLYQYQELLEQGRRTESDNIIQNIWGSGSIQSSGAKPEHRENLSRVMQECSWIITMNCDENPKEKKYGSRSDRLYERLRHDIDNITINTIYSNYTAEMALKYYNMAEEANTEGEAYHEMIGSMHFLNDDLNNDTCQFNIACDRFLLNCGVVAEQRRRLEKLYKNSNVYNLRKGYIEGPKALNDAPVGPNQFDRSKFINSEYN